MSSTSAVECTLDAAQRESSGNGVALALAFPGRRYHATPWGHHVNEGLIEWPPSPWRLLRSFLATGYTRLHWPKEGPPSVGRSLIEKLSMVLPHYRLPHAVGTHSRHYMPLGRFKNAREETTLVLDTWAQVDGGSIVVHWNVSLTSEERRLFAEIAHALGYLGRSESWVEASLMQGDDIVLSSFDIRPGDACDRPGPGWEQVALLATLPPSEYLDWRERAVQVAVQALPKTDAKGKPLKDAQRVRQREQTCASYPADLIACLQVDTGWLQDLGWNQPPGSRRVFYWRRTESLETAAPRVRLRSMRSATAEFMLLSMATANGNLNALPSVARTLPQGDLLHRALISRARKSGTAPSALTGCDFDGNPLREEVGHRHVHLIHLDLDDDGHLDHVLLWAPMGLDADAQRIVRAVRVTFTKGGVEPLRLALVATGSRSDLLTLPPPWQERLHRLFGGPSGGARHWRSVTPFVPPRFLKPRGRNALTGQVAAELAARGFPEPTSICTLDSHADDDLVRRSRHFVRRRDRLPPPVDCGFMLELQFEKPVLGPVVLGYGSHFGLGLLGTQVECGC